jgi:hypothetical protein
MHDNERLNVEFERINRKLDELFDVVAYIAGEMDMKDYREDLKDAEDKAKIADIEVEIKRDNKHWVEERSSGRRRNWYDIDRVAAERYREIER